MSYSAPPESLMIDGVEYQIDTDFRRWVEFYMIAKEGGDLEAFFGELGLPLSESAVKAVCDFFSGPLSYGSGNSKNSPASFDFYIDSETIYSAFYGAYKIDLLTEHIHWWRFMALFRSLPQDCEFCRIMHYRVVDIKDVPKEQKAFYRDMKARYSLAKTSGMTLEERNEEMKRRVREAFEEAEKQMSLLRGDKQPGVDRP